MSETIEVSVLEEQRDCVGNIVCYLCCIYFMLIQNTGTCLMGGGWIQSPSMVVVPSPKCSRE